MAVGVRVVSAVVVGVVVSVRCGVRVAVAVGVSVGSGWVQAARSSRPVAKPSTHGKRIRTSSVYQQWNEKCSLAVEMGGGESSFALDSLIWSTE